MLLLTRNKECDDGDGGEGGGGEVRRRQRREEKLPQNQAEIESEKTEKETITHQGARTNRLLDRGRQRKTRTSRTLRGNTLIRFDHKEEEEEEEEEEEIDVIADY